MREFNSINEPCRGEKTKRNKTKKKQKRSCDTYAGSIAETLFLAQSPSDWLTFPDVGEESTSSVTLENDLPPASYLLFLFAGDSGKNTDAGPLY